MSVTKSEVKTTIPGFALLDNDGEMKAHKNFHYILKTNNIPPENPSEYFPDEYGKNPEELFRFLKKQNFFEWTIEGTDDGAQRVNFQALYLTSSRAIVVANEAPPLPVEASSKGNAFKQVVEQSGHSIVITDKDGKITYVNPALEETTGYSKEELIGRNPRILQSGYHSDRFYEDLWDTILSGENWNDEIINQRKDGEYYVIDQSIAPLTDSLGEITGFMAVNQEITEKVEKRKKLEEKADEDPLLNIPTQEVIIDKIDAINHQKSHPDASLFIIAIDNYKSLEESWGLRNVNPVMKTLLNRIRTQAHPEDVLGKMHDNELLLFSNRFSEEMEARQFAENLTDEISHQFHFDGDVFDLEISLGYTFNKSNEKPTEALIDEADTALLAFQEKEEVLIQQFLPEHREIRSQNIERMKLTHRLQEGLVKEKFTAHYQPIIDLSTMEITGLEALMRWDHPEEGILTPGSFIQEARNKNLLTKLENQIMTDSFRFVGKLNEELDKDNHKLHVNVEPEQFGNDAFPAKLKRNLDDTSLKPESVNVEIVESDKLRDENALKNLKEIKDLGFNLAVDDFGTGFSSLDYLTKVPAETVKIDRSLIAEINENNPSSPVLFAIISMLQNLGKSIVVEGIETQFQHQTMFGMNCDNAQGYLYGKPMNTQDIRELIRNYEPSTNS